MDYRYSVQGRAEQAFILRGFYFPIGKQIDMDISETELPFVKNNCKLDKVVDRAAPSDTMPVKPKNIQRGATNGQRRTSKKSDQGTV